MKCTIPEISWHNREPVLSIDIQPQSEDFFRLVTGGADCHVLIWQLNICDNGAVKIEALSDLTRHQKAVNCVRWSPTGQYLATADDDANIIIWQLKTDNIPLLEGETNDKETWTVFKVMRGHKEDIYDLSWAPSGQKLLSGSIDNTAILWDFTKGSSDVILKEHKGFVQGVCWDPKGHYFSTISTDRVCRIYESTGKQVKARIQRGLLPVPKDHYLYGKDVKFFHDDTFKSFFRRLDFSPEGTLLAVPSGRVEIEDCKKILYGTYIFAVDSWTGPVAVFPSGKQCSTVARFCPILFELHEDGPESIISLPFRMIIAVGTDHDVILYDTQQLAPFAYFKDIHYTRLTDLTWSKDGLLLVASSTDGFCALITFEPNELGVQYVKEESEVEESVMDVSGCEELDKEDTAECAKPKKPSFLEQWTIKTPKRINKGGINTEEVNTSSISKRKIEEQHKEIKRIKPIPVLQTEKTSEILNVKQLPDKVSPLLKFLKAAPKDKVKETKKTKIKNPASSLQTVDVIVDEAEARDAWKCEKDEKRPVPENDIIEISELTEEFSLHLEDSNEASKNENRNENKTENTKSSEDNRIEDTESPSSKSMDEINMTVDNENVNAIKDTNSRREDKEINDQETIKTEDCVQNKNSIDKTQLKNTQDTTVKPKRRIPLITLSSPKHKKKSEI